MAILLSLLAPKKFVKKNKVNGGGTECILTTYLQSAILLFTFSLFRFLASVKQTTCEKQHDVIRNSDFAQANLILSGDN